MFLFCRRFLGGGFGGGGMFLMMGFRFLITLAIVFLILKIMKANPPSYFSPLSDSALNILNERYAKGEINEDEYTKKKIILTKKGSVAKLL